ncbi:unnamed protein product, partial [Linum tenue]
MVAGDRNGEPALHMSVEFKAKICAPWQNTLVVRLLGLRIGFVTLCNRLKSLWRPTGSMEVKDLDHDCFLVKLHNEQDYIRTLTDGLGSENSLLPQGSVEHVGNLLGRTIKLDYHTLTQQRAKFARLAVEVNLSKHLVPIIWLDDEWQKVEYENLPEVSFECGKIGHLSATCPQILTMVSLAQQTSAGGSPPISSPAQPEDPNPGFGTWMMVTRKYRRNSRDVQRKGKVENDLGNHTTTIVSKNGKGGQAVKEGKGLLGPRPISVTNGKSGPKLAIKDGASSSSAHGPKITSKTEVAELVTSNIGNGLLAD